MNRVLNKNVQTQKGIGKLVYTVKESLVVTLGMAVNGSR